MTRTEHLLTILGEECAEVAQRVSKALRFGPTEIQPGQPLTNMERVGQELADLIAVYDMLIIDQVATPPELRDLVPAKKAKVEKFLRFSAARGTVDGMAPDLTFPHPEATT